MNIRPDKLQRLTHVARRYYEQDCTQNEIARELGVSRPLISRMLREAKDLGIVEIRIRGAGVESPVLTLAKSRFRLQGGALVDGSGSDIQTNAALVESTLDYLRALSPVHLGIGWGYLIGELVAGAEKRPPQPGIAEHICPLIGNSGASIRNYHSNENVRILARQFGAQPHYLYSPAFADNGEERALFERTEHYKEVEREWQALDVALVNIGNYPTTPDFAAAHYGSILQEKHAAGRMVAYYFTREGEIIESPSGNTVQIPLVELRSCKCVIALCSANTSARALLGALRTGLVTHVVCCEQLLAAALEMP